MIWMKLGTAAPTTTAWIIAVALFILYRSKFIKIIILNIPIELPDKLQRPVAMGINK